MPKLMIWMFLFSFAVCGCATHAPIKTPDLTSDLVSQREKQVKNDVEVMMLPIHDKQDLKAYFDEDLILFGVLPVKVNIDNLGTDPCFIGVEYAQITDSDGNRNPAMNLEQVYDHTYKSYWRTAGWGVAFGVLGAVPSLINVAVTNDKIKADYNTCMLKDGEMPGKSHTEGTLFFEIDEKTPSLDGWKFQIGLEKNGEPFYFVFDLSGPIEQPRIKREPKEEKEDK